MGTQPSSLDLLTARLRRHRHSPPLNEALPERLTRNVRRGNIELNAKRDRQVAGFITRHHDERLKAFGREVDATRPRLHAESHSGGENNVILRVRLANFRVLHFCALNQDNQQIDLVRLEAERVALAHECWRDGDLEFLLHADQRTVRRLIRKRFSGGARRFVLEIARKWGKSILLVALCCEEALRGPKRRIVYGAPTLKMLQEFVHPAFDIVCADAPPEMRPVWSGENQHYTFPHNGSWVHLFGADDLRAAKRGRGPEATLAVFDECAYTSVLNTVLTQVFRPSLQRTGAPTILSSSPADTPAHEFTDVAELEEVAGNYANRSWFDNPLLTDEMRERELEEMAREAGSTVEEYVKSDTYLREYMGKRVLDPRLVAIPEWAEVEAECTVAIPRPKLFRGHEGIDFGGTDPHFVAFGYWHLVEGLVIEHELYLRADQVHDELSVEIKAKEQECWGTTRFDGTLEALADATLAKRFGDRIPDFLRGAVGKRASAQPHIRVVDHNMDLVRMLYETGIACLPAQKDEKRFHVQRLRSLVKAKQLKVHPRCVNLLRHLKQTTWKDERRTEWARKAGDHGDGIDALLYMTRDLNRDVPVEPAPDIEPVSMQQARAILGDSPMARKLLGGRR